MKFELVDPGEEPAATEERSDLDRPDGEQVPADPGKALAASTARLVAEVRDTATRIDDSVNGLTELLARRRAAQLPAGDPPVSFRPALFGGRDDEGSGA
ncbi:hypothetical protein [Actinomadura craniellae]|uniref:hypothetical protein n=1 Tax=Actinomadura craniellae TaxID=2231787 RepID=UPI0011BDF8B7|nr:hypothetical protein [Actinomadura craniellae]